jgi:hypothetical protein
MIKAIIYLSAVSRTVAQVRLPFGRFFRRCPEHENLLCLDGKALDIAEFNAVAPKLLTPLTITQIGSLPCVKLVEVPDAVSEPAPDVTPPEVAPTPAPVVSDPEVIAAATPPMMPLPENVFVEEVEGGVILSDLRSGAIFLGQGESGWQEDVSLVEPFASDEAATAAFFAHVSAPPAPAAEATAPAKKSHHKKK